MKYYLGPFQYIDDATGPHWAGPTGSHLVFDFRPLNP